MSAEEILGIYKDIIKNPDKLQQGKELLENFINTVPQFATLTCKIITSTEVESLTRKNVSYVIKNVLKDCWMVSPALGNERQGIKEILLNGVVENLNDSKIIEVLSLIIAELIKQEGSEGWQPYLNELIRWINTEEIIRIKAGVECLCVVFEKTDDRIRNVVPDLMPVLYQIFNLSGLPERLREKVLMLLYLAINSFSWAERSDDQLIHDCFDSTYEKWLQIFIEVLQTPPRQHLGMKKYILKILTKIFGEIPRYAKQGFAVIIQPVWKFMNSTLPLFIWSVVYGIPVELVEDGMKVAPQGSHTAKPKNIDNDGFELDENIDLSNEVEAVAVQLIELMQTLLPHKKLRSFVKFGLFPLVNCISHYMLFSKYQEKTWFEEPNEFQAEEEDTQNMVSIRKEVLEILSSLVTNFEDEAIQAIMIISEKFLANMREEEVYGHLKDVINKLNNSTSKSAALSNFDSDKLIAMIQTSHFEGEHDDHVWKKREIGLLLMGSFAEDIVDFLIRTTPDYNVLTLIEKLVSDFDNNTNPILKGRALWCATQFSEVVARQGIKPILTLYKLGAGCIGVDNHLPVRLAAAKAIRTFAYQIHSKFIQDLTQDIKTEYRLNDVQVAIDIFELLPKCSEDTLHIVLEGLLVLAKINADHIPRHSELLCTKIVQMFQMVHNDPLNGELIKDIIKHYSTNPQGYLQLAQVFLPYIAEILQFKLNGNALAGHLELGTSTEDAFLSSIFDIIRLFVTAETSEKQTDHLMELYPFILKYIAATSDYALLSHASVCLKAYLAHCSQQILQRNYLDDTLSIIHKMLEPETEDVACTYLGNIIILAFANLLNNSINQDILKKVINKLYHCQVPSTIQSLVLVYARLINLDEKDTLEFLCSFSIENIPALEILMTKWLSYQPLFIGKNTKVLTFLALTKLLLAKDSRLETLQFKNEADQNASGVWTPFKILSLLVKGLDAEVQNRANANSEINAYKEFIQDGDEGDGFEDVDDDDDYEDDKAPRRNKEDDYADYNDGEGIPGDFAVEEAERLAEEDLEYLKDPNISIDLLEMFKSFFTTVPKTETEYFMFCMKKLPSEDVQTLQKYLEFK